MPNKDNRCNRCGAILIDESKIHCSDECKNKDEALLNKFFKGNILKSGSDKSIK